MAAVSLSITGGDKIAAALRQMADRLANGGDVAVGFLEGATYPAKPGAPALSVPQVAFWNEFGNGFAPPRPFFRRMIAAKSPAWGKLLAAAAKKAQYSSPKTLAIVGEVIQGQLKQSINELTSPPLAASTIRRKGFDKPLIDTSVMVRAVDYEVKA